MIARHIKTILEENGKVAIPGMGTFTTSVFSAKIDAETNTINPAGSKISFVESIDYAEKGKIIDSIIKEQDISDKVQVEFDIRNFTEKIREDLKNNGKATIRGLGFFSQDDYGHIVFEQEENVNFLSASFGLPKLSLSKVVPLPISETTATTESPITETAAQQSETQEGEVKDKKSDLILWLILIPLVVITAFLLYFFFNESAMKNLQALNPFQSNQSELVEIEANDTNNPTAITSTKKDEAKDDTKKEISKTEDKKIPVAKKKEEVKKETPKPVANNLVVTSKTNRFYLIYGSFSTLNNAKKAVTAQRKKGYKTAKVLQVNGKNRVSLADFTSQQEADVGIRKHQGKFKGIWVFPY